jgi:hypothetical protein
MHIPVAIRRAVADRAQNCCEFCLVPQSRTTYSFQFDHVIARKHRGETTAENLCLTGPWCNSHKGTDLNGIDDDTGNVVALFNPRKQVWIEHFQLDGALILGISETGRTTIATLKLNDLDQVAFRTALLDLGVYPGTATS